MHIGYNNEFYLVLPIHLDVATGAFDGRHTTRCGA